METASWADRIQDWLNRRIKRRVGLLVKVLVPALLLFVLFSALLGIWVASSSRTTLLEQSRERTAHNFTTCRYLLEKRMGDLADGVTEPLLLLKLAPLIEKGMVDLTGGILSEVQPLLQADFLHVYDAAGKFIVSSERIISYLEPQYTASLAREMAAGGKKTVFLALLPREIIEFEGLDVPSAAGASGECLAIIAFAPVTDDWGDAMGHIMACDILTGDQKAVKELSGLLGAQVTLSTASRVAATTLQEEGILGNPLPGAMVADLAGKSGAASGAYRIGKGTYDTRGEWLAGRGGERVGVLSVMNPVDQALAKSRSLRNGVLLGGLLLLAVFALLLGVVLRTLLSNVTRNVAFMESVAAGNLGGSIESHTRDELEVLSEAINRTVGNLRKLLGDVEGSFSMVEEVSGSLVDMAASVNEGTLQEEAAVRKLDATTAALTDVVGKVAGEMVSMKRGAEENLASLRELSTTVDSVAQDAQGFASSAEGTSSAIQQSATSIGEVTKSVASLTRNLEQANGAMGEIERAIRRIKELSDNANATSRELYDDAVEKGRGAMQRARAGMDSINGIITSLGETVRKAGAKSEEIGEIVDIISSIADQTSLLALNASILAAQAGEEGKGFAVVADEIRTLSSRTHESIKEIAERIGSIQEGSRESVQGVERGIVAVRGGVAEVKQVGAVLDGIIAGVTKSRELSEQIAAQTEAQAAEAGRATRMLVDISGMATEIAAAMNQQDETGRYIMKLADDIRQKAESMRVVTDQQSAAVRGIRSKTEGTAAVTDALSRRVDGAKGDMGSVREVIDIIGQVTEENRRRVARLREAVELLENQADKVRSQISAFKLDA